ncbi:group 1 glycosyl transferase [Gammaproteobacteria bacterium 42_54_T18]|nr:group 1 glycosyl transferase [Gammaproteobacteria bacterium 42_54_T18]
MDIIYLHRIASKDGQYVHVEELTNAILEQGHDIRFIAPQFTDESEFGSDGGFVSKLKEKLPQFVYEILELSYSLLIALKLVVAILQKRPDFIYERYNLYQPAGVIVAKLFGLPLLLEVNAPLFDERRKYSGIAIPWLAKAIENFTWRQATKVLPVTQVLANIVMAHGVSKGRIEVVHNGINEHVYDKFNLVPKTDENPEIVVGFVGFLNPWHRLDLAVEAMGELKHLNIRLLCVGEGNDNIRETLLAQSHELGIPDRVEFTGLKARDEVFDYVKQFDIALQPAVTPYASPLKLFEYLAAGSVIVAPDSSNILEIVDEKTSILFENENLDSFKEKLKYAITHFNELFELRENARRLVLDEGFTWQGNARRVVDMGKKCMESRGKETNA